MYWIYVDPSKRDIAILVVTPMHLLLSHRGNSLKLLVPMHLAEYRSQGMPITKKSQCRLDSREKLRRIAREHIIRLLAKKNLCVPDYDWIRWKNKLEGKLNSIVTHTLQSYWNCFRECKCTRILCDSNVIGLCWYRRFVPYFAIGFPTTIGRENCHFCQSQILEMRALYKSVVVINGLITEFA